MYLNLQYIHGLLPKSTLYLFSSDISLINYALPGQISDTAHSDIVYVISNLSQISSLALIPKNLILIQDKNTNSDIESFAKENELNILYCFSQDYEMDYVKSLVHNFFSDSIKVSQFSEALLNILFSNLGIQKMVDSAYSFFGNPIYVFDAGFQLLATNWTEAQKTQHGQRMIANKGFSQIEFDLVNHNGKIHEKVKKSSVPLQVYHPEIGVNQLLYALNTQKDIGHIVICAANRDFQDIDYKYLSIFKEVIVQQLRNNEFIRNSKGFNYEYLIKDLLDGKVAMGEHLSVRMKYVDGEFSGINYCLVVEIARSSSTVNPTRIRNAFESLSLKIKTLIYEGEIIIILTKDCCSYLTKKERDKLKHLCEELEIYCGLSNAFESIIDLKDYYKQALRSIELGICIDDRPGLFIYEKYYMSHIKNIFLQKESAEIFCHPKIKRLKSYDLKYNTKFCHTIYMYLLHERNIAVTAESLNLHRNTLTYRLKKIRNLIDIDSIDYSERQYLILSCLLLFEN